jgi:hypothetical protein
MTTIQPLQQLINQQNYHQWLKQTRQLGASKATQYHVSGLSSALFTAPEWFKAHQPGAFAAWMAAGAAPATLAADMAAAQVPNQLIIPNFVTLIAAGVAAADRDGEKARYEREGNLIDEASKFKLEIIQSMRQEDQEAMLNPTLQINTFTLLEIMQFAQRLYGIMSPTDIEFIQQQLQQPLTTPNGASRVSNFIKYQVQFMQYLVALEQTPHATINQHNQLAFLERAIQGHISESHAFQRFKEINIANPHDMTFAQATKFIIDILKNAPLTPDIYEDSINAVRATSHKMSSKTGGKQSKPANGEDTNLSWCYIHGHKGHVSSKCKFMCHNPMFTSAQKTATKSDVANKIVPEYKWPDKP